MEAEQCLTSAYLSEHKNHKCSNICMFVHLRVCINIWWLFTNLFEFIHDDQIANHLHFWWIDDNQTISMMHVLSVRNALITYKVRASSEICFFYSWIRQEMSYLWEWVDEVVEVVNVVGLNLRCHSHTNLKIYKWKGILHLYP